MGRTRINQETCITYESAKVCTQCFDACPYPEQAITLDADFHPQILDGCVGCGQCLPRCPAVPAAIEVLSPLAAQIKDTDDAHYFGVIPKDE